MTLPLFEAPREAPPIPTRTGRLVVRLPLLTNSRMKTHRRCAMLHDLAYNRGYRAVERAAPLHFGDLMHRGLEAWWLALQDGEDQLLAALAAVDSETDPFDRAKARVLLIGYHERWKDEPFEVLAVEAEYRAPLVNPNTGAASLTWQLGGKLDVIARDLRQNRIVFIEHKTSASDVSTGSTYWQRLRMDSQVSCYFVGAEALGYPAEACLYDVLGKPALDPYKATPVEKRQYTQEKRKKCDVCKGRGCLSNPVCVDGKILTTPSRLYSSQREADETPAEYEARLLEAVAAEPDRYYIRGEVVRLDEELRHHARDVWQTAKLIRHGQTHELAPRNVDACGDFGRRCDFLDFCAGQASLEDTTRFIRSDDINPELSTESPTTGIDDRGVDHGNPSTA